MSNINRVFIGGLVTVAILASSLMLGRAEALSYYSKYTTGVDISWPNCQIKSVDNATFGIVGVTGGLGFHPNPCIGKEASFFRNNLSLYVNTAYPGRSYALAYESSPKHCSENNESCLAYNYGYNAGKYATNYALSHGVVSTNWWLDVEVINSWSTNTSLNRNSLQGQVDAIKQQAQPTLIGFYTYPPEWGTITGNWLNKAPQWVTSNSNYRNAAENYCTGQSFTGGQTRLAQYVTELDSDITC